MYLLQPLRSCQEPDLGWFIRQGCNLLVSMGGWVDG
jgi:hypothetical protein